LNNTLDIFRNKDKYKIFETVETLNENQYTLMDAINNSIEKNIEPIKSFVQTFVNEQDIKLDLFYYPLTEKESILVLNNYQDNTEIVESLCDFCDLHRIILSIDETNKIDDFQNLGFIENESIHINEYLIRHPQDVQINESVMLFSDVKGISKAVDLMSTNVQSHTYKQDWYDEYIKLINSDEYKKRRHKETHGVLINRNASRNRGCVPKVGFAIVGKCKVQ
jgi:hypothetical protein